MYFLSFQVLRGILSRSFTRVQARTLVREPKPLSKSRNIDISPIVGNIQLTPHLASFAFADKKRINEFRLCSAIKPLRNVRHRRNGGAPHLTLEIEIPERRIVGDVKNKVGQLARLFPANQIFKLFYGSHCSIIYRNFKMSRCLSGVNISICRNIISSPTPLPYTYSPGPRGAIRQNDN